VKIHKTNYVNSKNGGVGVTSTMSSIARLLFSQNLSNKGKKKNIGKKQKYKEMSNLGP
jgi:hypothetical protein